MPEARWIGSNIFLVLLIAGGLRSAVKKKSRVARERISTPSHFGLQRFLQHGLCISLGQARHRSRVAGEAQCGNVQSPRPGERSIDSVTGGAFCMRFGHLTYTEAIS